ncbi:unnamed protein product [Mytilus edulis]|uniref:C-type lectin domain-containing protein n=1 Tax=Mytilus edulis TaxID=6550 RepID=A0A8S3TG53_MYTED|nr:unnamed protein product [Mytilus edulis]
MGSVWMSDDYTEYNASMLVPWSNGKPNNPPHLCVYNYYGYMFDYDCMTNIGVVCQRDQEYCPTNDPVWKHNGLWCYIVLLYYANGVTYDEAKYMCSNINGTVIMPKTRTDARWITYNLDFGGQWWIGLTDNDADNVYTWEDGTNQNLSTLYWFQGSDTIDPQPNARDNASLCAVMIDGEIYDVVCSTNHKVVCQVDAKTGLQTTLYNQTTKLADSETTTLPTETTGIPATFYNQTTNLVSLETTTFRSETTGIPATFYNQTTKHAKLETTTLPATNMSLTFTSLECEALWMNQRNCNCQEPSASTEIQNDIIMHRLDKTMLSSNIRKKSSASDPRRSSFYIGCVGIIVLVSSMLFIVVLDFIPRG